MCVQGNMHISKEIQGTKSKELIQGTKSKELNPRKHAHIQTYYMFTYSAAFRRIYKLKNIELRVALLEAGTSHMI